jgi:hypothetical protein
MRGEQHSAGLFGQHFFETADGGGKHGRAHTHRFQCDHAERLVQAGHQDEGGPRVQFIKRRSVEPPGHQASIWIGVCNPRNCSGAIRVAVAASQDEARTTLSQNSGNHLRQNLYALASGESS